MARKLPTGEGKNRVLDQVRQTNCDKRAEVLQAAGAQQNIGSAEEEEDLTYKQQSRNPKRPKAGR